MLVAPLCWHSAVMVEGLTTVSTVGQWLTDGSLMQVEPPPARTLTLVAHTLTVAGSPDWQSGTPARWAAPVM